MLDYWIGAIQAYYISNDLYGNNLSAFELAQGLQMLWLRNDGVENASRDDMIKSHHQPNFRRKLMPMIR